jgi:hypothetical protein
MSSPDGCCTARSRFAGQGSGEVWRSMRGLIEPFTAQPEAPARKKAGAFGWAVNESEQRASCTNGDDKILVVQKPLNHRRRVSGGVINRRREHNGNQGSGLC